MGQHGLCKIDNRWRRRSHRHKACGRPLQNANLRLLQQALQIRDPRRSPSPSVQRDWRRPQESCASVGDCCCPQPTPKAPRHPLLQVNLRTSTGIEAGLHPLLGNASHPASQGAEPAWYAFVMQYKAVKAAQGSTRYMLLRMIRLRRIVMSSL